MRRAIAAGARLVVGGTLAWSAVAAALTPGMPAAATLVTLAVLAAALWRPGTALVILAAAAPAAGLFAAAPARAAEMAAWALLGGWLLRVWAPLARGGWPRHLLLPGLLVAATALASWVASMVAGGAGIDPAHLPLFLAHVVSPGYLVDSAQETSTWTLLQLLAATGVFAAAAAAAREDARVAPRAAGALVASMAVLGVLTIADVVRQWAGADYGTWFLLRYARGERYAWHLADLNAAGSQYVLAFGIAAAAWAAAPQGRRWLGAALVMLPAFWLTGSRSAVVGAAAAVGAAALLRRQPAWHVRRSYVVAAAAVALLAVVSLAALAAFGSDAQGSAGRALRLRTQFTQTSVRMIASAPVFGVGVGGYFDRSPAFMPRELRELYGAENAHNYFAQQFAELGLVGGLVFLWLVAALGLAGWRQASADRRGAAAALFAGNAGFIVTCLTGHPFLVSEAALPFWIAAGLLTGADVQPPDRRRTLIATAVAVLLLVNVGRGVQAYASVTTMPWERGFERAGVADDGTRYRWTSAHVVSYVPDGPGFLRMTLRAADTALPRPVTVDTFVGGRFVDRQVLPRGAWVTREIPVRAPAGGPFRRVDVLVSPTWTDTRTIGRRREVRVSMGVMVAELRWVTPQGR